MPCEIATSSKVLLAIFTLFGVSSDVHKKIGICCKALLAIFTLMRFLLGASSDVPFPSKVLLAIFTLNSLIRFLSRVNSDVHKKMVFVVKLFWQYLH